MYYLIKNPLRYNELRRKLVGVNERTLSLQLRQLEEDGVIDIEVYGEKPLLKVEYSLTDFGKTLIPLLKLIADWGDFVIENQLRNNNHKETL